MRSGRRTSGESASVVALSLPPPQPGPALEELGPRGRDDEQRDVGHPVDELVEKVEEALVGPVDVLDDDDERTLLGETLEEAAPGGERLVSAIASELRFAGEAEEREEMRLDARLVARAGERVLDDLVDLRRDVLRACPARGRPPAP